MTVETKYIQETDKDSIYTRQECSLTESLWYLHEGNCTASKHDINIQMNATISLRTDT